MTITQKDIEAILGECVGEDCERKKYEPTDFLAHRADYNDGYNQALADIRNRIPETARKVLDRVREDMTKLGILYGADLYIESKNARVVENVTKYLENAYPKPKTDEELEKEVASLAGEDEGDNGKDND